MARRAAQSTIINLAFCSVGQAKVYQEGISDMRKLFFVGVILTATTASWSAQAARHLADYVDANGFLNVQALTCAQLEESQNCAYDYRQYCGQDGLGSQLLALCMKDHGKELSPQCIKALEDAGEVTPEEKAELKKIGE